MANELNLDIIEFSPDSSQNQRYSTDLETTNSYCAASLSDFLHGVKFSGTCLVLVKDFPAMCRKSIVELQEYLRSLSANKYNFKLCFLFSSYCNDANLVSKQDSFETPKSVRDLVSDDLMFLCLVVSFNKASKTIVKRALTRIANSIHYHKPEKVTELIAEQCHGDLRNGILAFQFYFQHYHHFRKKGQPTELLNCFKKPASSIFSSLGKIIYEKRTLTCIPTSHDNLTIIELPESLKHWERPPFDGSYYKLVTNLFTSIDAFLIMLNANLPHKVSSFDGLVFAAENYAFADCLINPELEIYRGLCCCISSCLCHGIKSIPYMDFSSIWEDSPMKTAPIVNSNKLHKSAYREMCEYQKKHYRKLLDCCISPLEAEFCENPMQTVPSYWFQKRAKKALVLECNEDSDDLIKEINFD